MMSIFSYLKKKGKMDQTCADRLAENSEKLQGSISIPLFQLKVPRTNCEQIALPSSSRACEHVHNKKRIYIYMK